MGGPLVGRGLGLCCRPTVLVVVVVVEEEVARGYYSDRAWDKAAALRSW